MNLGHEHLMNKPDKRPPSNSMARITSFVALLVILVIFTMLFYQVMKTFILPLFLAALTVVIFKPFHVWVLTRSKGRKQLAAFITTLTVALMIFGPVAMLTFFAIDEARQLKNSEWDINQEITGLRQKFQLVIPAKRSLDAVRDEFDRLLVVDENGQAEVNISDGDINRLADDLRRLEKDLGTACRDALSSLPLESIEALDSRLSEPELQTLERLWQESSRGGPAEDLGSREQSKIEKQACRYVVAMEAVKKIGDEITPFAKLNTAGPISDEEKADLAQVLARALSSYDNLRSDLLGGIPWSVINELAHPTAQQIADWKSRAGGYLTKLTLFLSGRTPAVVVRTLLVLSIMLIAVYYFLIDGPEMIKTLMRLSPIDDHYETELLAEFDNVSRAVVLATLLSAIAQGILAGIGYYLFGVPSVFLLTLLTGILAMIPFVGAAAVWIPACIYLGFVLDPPRATAAVGLAVYGLLIVSMADNVIKPFILHGQSNLHPLLALLSVLGGVQALGPVGILVGPMVVAFLQALLNILRMEMQRMEKLDA